MPKAVLRMLPADSAEYVDGNEVVAKEPTAKVVETPEGTWTFAGYDESKLVVDGSDVKFKGKWEFKATPSTPLKKPTKVLPNTGETATNAGLVGVAGLGLVALAIAARRRSKK